MEYILNGKSPIYLNGKKLPIFCIHIGKNGNGTIEPINVSATTPYIVIEPFPSKVNIVKICTIKFKDDTNNNPKNKVLLLERYNSDIDTVLNTSELIKKNKENIINKNHLNMQIDYLTIHKSKGLEYDDCILINAIDDKYGFPSKIEDEKIISILKPKIKENITYPEERRLFYVAITRTKNKLYILVPKSKVSSFIKEISVYKNVIINDIVKQIN